MGSGSDDASDRSTLRFDVDVDVDVGEGDGSTRPDHGGEREGEYHDATGLDRLGTDGESTGS